MRACVAEGEPNHWPTLVTDSVSVSVASNAPPHSKSLMHSCLGSDSGNLNHRPIYLLVCLFVFNPGQAMKLTCLGKSRVYLLAVHVIILISLR